VYDEGDYAYYDVYDEGAEYYDVYDVGAAE
jgi:hypothetical protein